MPDETNAGIMPTNEALKLAQSLGQDLIEINPKSNPVVCKIANYGKFKYEEKKKLAAEKKKQSVQEMKELLLRPNTDEHDLLHKINQAKEFLTEGYKVRFTCKFRGREVSHSNLGKEKLEYILQQLQGLVSDKSQISLEGKIMSITVSPAKKS